MSTILIVDDRESNREYLITVLSHRGHRLLEAADGAEALAIVKAHRPDLVIADVLMPTMDGYELVRQLRADPSLATTRVVFCTGHYQERDAQILAKTGGVFWVLTKPSEPHEILNVVEDALRRDLPATAAAPAGDFDRKHLRLLTDKLAQKAEALEVTNDRLSALIELSLQLGSELNLRRLLQSFCHAAREIIGARFSIVGLLDLDGSRFQSLYTSGMDAGTAARLSSPDPKSEALKGILWKNQCIRKYNPGGDPLAIGLSALHPPVHAWLAAPITSSTRVYGYVGLIDRVGQNEFSAEDERLTLILAAQVGRVYQNGSLYADVLKHASSLEREIAAREKTEKALAERLRQGLLVGEIGEALTKSDTANEMLQRCAEAMLRHLDLALARIWTFDSVKNVLELKASAGLSIPDAGPQSREPLKLLDIGLIAQKRTPHFSNEVLTDPVVNDKEWARREGIVAFSGYPLVVEGRVVGVVTTFSFEALNAATQDAIGSVARQIALGIQRTLMESSLREREAHIRLLLDSTAEPIYGIDLDGKCNFANASCAELLRYSSPAYFWGREMHALIHHTRADGALYPFHECRGMQALRKGEGVHADDEVLWRRDGSSFPAEYWSHPVYRNGQLVGAVITFLDITERKQLEKKVAKKTAELRRTNDRLRAISMRIEAAREEERTRIAREIHDELGSALTSLRWDMQGLRTLARSEHIQATDLLRRTDDMLQLTDNTIKSLKNISADLRPSILDHLGVIEAARWQTRQIELRTGINCKFECSLLRIDLRPEHSTAVFRILQEALTNILRHAQATKTHVVLDVRNGILILEVRDNGRGFRPDDASQQVTTGVWGMEERAHLLGGKVEINSDPGQGTTVILRVPLNHAPGVKA